MPQEVQAQILSAEDGEIHITPENGALRVSLRPKRADLYIPVQSCLTRLPLPLVLYLAEKSTYAWLCSILGRYDDASDMNGIVRRQLLSYFRPEQFRGKRLLDFGCGAGASTMGIAAMLPDTEVIGVELMPDLVATAREVAALKGLKNVRFECSPSGDALPPGLGTFDFVTLCAVYEHLLPNERKQVMPMLWAALKPDGALFVNQTPYRYFPYEHHSTGLWFINYLPDRAALAMARRFARHNPERTRSLDWPGQLRAGIRGATEGEILRNLCSNGGRGKILQPALNGLKDRAGYWLQGTSPRHRFLKRTAAVFFRLTDRLAGTVPSLNVDVVIAKQA